MSGMTIYQFNAVALRKAKDRYAKALENFKSNPREFIAASLELHQAKGPPTRKPRRR